MDFEERAEAFKIELQALQAKHAVNLQSSPWDGAFDLYDSNRDEHGRFKAIYNFTFDN